MAPPQPRPRVGRDPLAAAPARAGGEGGPRVEREGREPARAPRRRLRLRLRLPAGGAVIRAGTRFWRTRTSAPAMGSGRAAPNRSRSSSASQRRKGRASRRLRTRSTAASSAPAGRTAPETSSSSSARATCPARRSAVRSAACSGPGRRRSAPSPMSRGRPASSSSRSAAESRVCTKPRAASSAAATAIGARIVTASPAVRLRSVRSRAIDGPGMRSTARQHRPSSRPATSYRSGRVPLESVDMASISVATVSSGRCAEYTRTATRAVDASVRPSPADPVSGVAAASDVAR